MSEATRTARTKTKVQQRRDKQKQELRALILEAASQEFLEHSYENFSLRRVAERIGYSPTTIYLYFQNKDELLLMTVQNGFGKFDETIEAAARGAVAPLEKIEAIGRSYIEFGLQNPALYRLMFMQRSDFYLMPRLLGSGTPIVEMEPSTEEVQHRVVAQELLVAAVGEGMSAGHIGEGDAVIVADALWAGAHGLVSLATSPLMEPDHARKVVDELLKMLLLGLKAKK